MMARIVQRGSGKGRNPWRIREYLSSLKDEDGKIMNMSSVAKRARVKHNVVSDTVRGIRNHGRVLKALEDLGCPKEYLYGDEDRLGEAA